MRKNEKGFTLIELLAVIIILAIIALIAVPTITSIISESKKSASRDSAYGVISAAELYYSTELLKGNGTFTAKSFTSTDSYAGLNIKGDKPTAGTVAIDANGGVTITKLKMGDYCWTLETAGGALDDEPDSCAS